MKETLIILAVTLNFACFRVSASDPAKGAYDAPPRPSSRLGRATVPKPLLFGALLPRGAFGAYVISYEDSIPHSFFYLRTTTVYKRNKSGETKFLT